MKLCPKFKRPKAKEQSSWLRAPPPVLQFHPCVIVLIVSLLIFAGTGLSLGFLLSPASAAIQNLCSEMWSLEPLATIGSAMVCGRELPTGEMKELFLRTGLYHVLVVSGAHLVLLSELWNALLPKSPRLRSFGLLGFALMSGLGAPLVRAGLQMIFQSTRPRRPIASVMASYLAALAFQPLWWNSISLHLSALAAIGMALPFAPRGKAFAVVLLTFPVILPFGSVDMTGVLTGLLLSPLIELGLFPLCLLAWIFPPLQSLINPLIHFGITALHTLTPWLGPPLRTGPLIPSALLGVYFLCVTSGVILFTKGARLSPRNHFKYAS